MNTLLGYRHILTRTSNLLAAFGSLVWLVLGLQWFRARSGGQRA
ncbi:MAG: hypothetical protein AVDCRST_MAG58-1174 [uncultured Rubrobacteraceae bacterium]|uniref:Uncharacterized protein n=1 Tax=uncultured Rubrobacteraceae bacterium TaxID=349277 RepID=A0A6J4QTZ7_9ACTN|nr:MAG: hypothetical protein AVDCRST_MAG58-1174 [uncultured Rubrobacteraceae bacterium]